mgnify:CR=1 FL=1
MPDEQRPDRVQLANAQDHRQRRGGVLADELEGLLVLGRRGVFHPEQVIGLQRLAQPRRLDRRQPVVHVVQQVRLVADGAAHRVQPGLWLTVSVDPDKPAVILFDERTMAIPAPSPPPGV